ncbi:hypothetical protein EST38_g10362 [Candolleomyces aberdarensis]|uniref:Uncharacterized protein n=1 Tax=Candolleomyces aberdarensis TaxID=2316362 RepID=A0A4Q2D974_9AGAR|nr:hypothetical protein EST38_g10362 [Candolleomyces aberdarensis]
MAVTWNLPAFHFDGKDYNPGTQDAFSSSSSASATDITTTGRHPSKTLPLPLSASSQNSSIPSTF